MDSLWEPYLAEASFAGTYDDTNASFHNTEKLNAFGQRIHILTAVGEFQSLVHRARPLHIRGRSDLLPFAHAQALETVFSEMNLPKSYLHICSGTPAAVVRTLISRDLVGKEYDRCDFIAHCNSKQCDWALAIRHERATMATSVFWSMDSRVDSDRMLSRLQSLRDYAFHPMLVPAIMLSHTVEMALRRRNQMKPRLQQLEMTIKSLHQRASQHSVTTASATLDWWNQQQAVINTMLQDLDNLKREQASCQGRYNLWSSLHDSIEQGLHYYVGSIEDDVAKLVHSRSQDLRHWISIMWQQLESIRSRDIDHVHRVADASDMLKHVLQQREAHLQSSIARAALQDSGDMKFIAMLGSIFLPAGLVASLLSIPQFQVVGDMHLMLLYVGVTIPLAGVLLAICFLRRWWAGRSLSRCRAFDLTDIAC